MFFNSRIVICAVALIGLGAPFYFLYGKRCSFVRTHELQKISLNVSEPVLECTENQKSYSIYLAPTEDSSLGQQNVSFKVVDNNSSEKKVKWGPGSAPSDKWDEWGIGIYKNSSGGGGIETKIRVPTGNIYRKGKVLITCQKSKLKFKENAKTCLGGSLLKSTNMKFEVDVNGDVKIKSESFDWSNDFKPKGMFCPY